MEANKEQVKSAIRWFIATFGGMLMGWGASKGWDVGTISSVINSEAVIGTASTVVVLIWGWFSKTKVGLINTAVSAVPEVKKIEIAPVSSQPSDFKTVDDIVKGTPPKVVAAS